MAIGTVIKMWSRSSGSFESEDLQKRVMRFREGYTIDHGVNENKSVILTATGLPRIGDVLENTTWVFAKRLIIARQWPAFTIVEVEYEGEVGPDDDPASGSPISDPPEISWENVVSVEPIDQDALGEPITTVLGEAIEGVTKQVSDLLLSVKRNYLTINLPVTHAYLESTNSDTWLGFQPGVAHLEKFKANHIVNSEAGVTYWEVDARVLFRVPYNTTPDKAWWARVRHEGYRFKAADGRIINAFEDNQANVSRPILLAPDGQPVVHEADGTVDPDNVDWLEFKRYPNDLPYSALGLV